MTHLNVLVLAQHDGDKIVAETYSGLTAARELKKHAAVNIDMLLIGEQCEVMAEVLSGCPDVDRVLVADHSVYRHGLAENHAMVLMALANQYTHVIAPATSYGKDVMPRFAALADVDMLSDVIAIETPDTVVRPIYAGNALARVQSHDALVVMTIRATAFDKTLPSQASTAECITLDLEYQAAKTQWISQEHIELERPDLTQAEVVVSGGRGLGSKDNFAMVTALADKLGGAIGASRAAVDAGFVSNDLQVGQTGKIVAPRLYIAVGISGAIQHVAGMKDSQVIVAINSDPDAPIFDVADYGLVGDLFELLPELIERI
ncbi:electron transfer flavoprotein subunit alpha/FixB family protein [Vibrio sp. JPW-9-11-11]|uniref:electron transfer flavoprotein subunit alpha/FixB family protein n=1 Tax=Vibrio sp. JPW-9-11-11 TaxID=1416532 RepID=UPI001594A4B7|nr:FAD-binding protein [Vibrio sp. JPW-9-11-11]NVD09007.1 electron transfer flavoprotein subunit alpha/FixB family protein [Vibrio sp. JPW-9-11-11]